MPTPAAGYRTKDGKRVPGTTTITGMFGDKQGIIYAANRLALEPLLQAHDMAMKELDGNVMDFLRHANPDNWDHKKFWGKAADAGTLTHERVDCFIHKKPFELGDRNPELLSMSEKPYQAFLTWAEQSRLEVGETEVQLVSERYRFGGTRDAMTVSGKRAVVDWKTSNDIYPAMLAQLAAYAILDEENTGRPIDGGFHLLRFSKPKLPTDPVHFSHHYWEHLDAGRKAFLLMRELYDLMAELSKLAK